MRIRSAIAVGIGGSVLALGAVALPAEASQQTVRVPSWCVGAHERGDINKYAVSCNVQFAYYAKVTCSNGSKTKTARGVVTNDNRESWAYCTAFGRDYRVVPGTGGPVKA
ncbi:hypothetical protein AB0K09_19345 [Streptomyces sp. NPDC049577]|uniref:hypothetical protein n=1 Tax=Streptomyces sp. NPDC049577 TaxID=3155153 RepID=UPI00343968A0